MHHISHRSLLKLSSPNAFKEDDTYAELREIKTGKKDGKSATARPPCSRRLPGDAGHRNRLQVYQLAKKQGMGTEI